MSDNITITIRPNTDENLADIKELRENYAATTAASPELLGRHGISNTSDEGEDLPLYVTEIAVGYEGDKPIVLVHLRDVQPDAEAKEDPLKQKAALGPTPLELVTDYNKQHNVGLNKRQREHVAHLLFSVYQQGVQNGVQMGIQKAQQALNTKNTLNYTKLNS